jgi:hypothetical protein
MTPREQYGDESKALDELRYALRDRARANVSVRLASGLSDEVQDRAFLAYGNAELRVVNARCALEAMLLEDA